MSADRGRCSSRWPAGRPRGAGHRRVARHRPGGGAALSPRKAPSWCWSARTAAAWRSSTTRSAPLGGQATLVPLDLTDYAEHRPDGRGALRALRPARRAGRQRRQPRRADAGRPHRRRTIWEQVLAVNLTANWRLIRSLRSAAAASPAGRAIFVTSGVAAWPRLLGRLCRQQGRARDDGPHLRRRGRRRPPSGSTSSIPGRRGPGCARRRIPARIRRR